MKLVRQHMLKRGCAIFGGGMSGGREAAVLGMRGRKKFAETRLSCGRYWWNRFAPVLRPNCAFGMLDIEALLLAGVVPWTIEICACLMAVCTSGILTLVLLCTQGVNSPLMHCVSSFAVMTLICAAVLHF